MLAAGDHPRHVILWSVLTFYSGPEHRDAAVGEVFRALLAADEAEIAETLARIHAARGAAVAE